MTKHPRIFEQVHYFYWASISTSLLLNYLISCKGIGVSMIEFGKRDLIISG